MKSVASLITFTVAALSLPLPAQVCDGISPVEATSLVSVVVETGLTGDPAARDGAAGRQESHLHRRAGRFHLGQAAWLGSGCALAVPRSLRDGQFGWFRAGLAGDGLRAGLRSFGSVPRQLYGWNRIRDHRAGDLSTGSDESEPGTPHPGGEFLQREPAGLQSQRRQHPGRPRRVRLFRFR